MPPAQFTVVPLRLTKSCTSSRRRLVEHQGARAAEAHRVVRGRAIAQQAAGHAGRIAVLAVSDETHVMVLAEANAPMPSSASGVGLPSDIVEPVWLKVT